MDYDVLVNDVTYTYPGTDEPALDGVSFSVGRGEILLVAGPSGAGKTTLCQTLNGMVPQSYGGEFRGKVLVKGIDTSAVTVGRLAFVAGLMFQDPSSQLVCPTVEDEVSFGPENKGLPVDMIETLTAAHLDYVGLLEYRKRSPHALSGGQQQAVAIAAVMAMEPDIYVLDEPTSNLDPVGSGTVIDLVNRLAKESGRTAVIVEHKLDKLMPMVDRVVVMDRGRLAYDGTPRSVVSNWAELEHMGIRPPQVAELVQRLRSQGLVGDGRIPITVDEAADDLRYLVGRITSDAAETSLKRLKRAPSAYRAFREAAVEVSDLRFRYPNGFEALKGANLTIGRGEFVAIVGQNGSGKTTLVKHFNGLLKPTEGRVSVFGMDTARATVSELATRIGHCFQNPDHQIFSSRVDDEIGFGPRNLGFSRAEVADTVARVASSLGLEQALSQNPHLLGKGQRQKIAVASVLAMGPEVLVVDEPTTGQDPRRSRDMMDVFRALNREAGKTVVVITHDMDLAAEYCDRIVVMCEGRVILDGTPREVFAKPDDLKKSRLESPQITRLMGALGFDECALLNVDEAYSFFTEVLEAGQP